MAEQQLIHPAGGSLSSTPAPPSISIANSLLAGTVSGIVQVLVGQPFDIVKVRLQSSNAYTGTANCVTRTLREEGPKAFYKGTIGPLIGIGACVSLQFAFLSTAKNFFVERNRRRSSSSPALLSPLQLYASGAFAGVGNSFVAGPVEHIRIRLQTQLPTSIPHYSGPLDAVLKIYKSDSIRGIFAGQGATTMREFHGYGLYFLAYEYLVQRKCQMEAIARKDIPTHTAMLYGATAGYAMWLLNYPMDVIKSRMQTDSLRSTGPRAYSSSLNCAQKLWRAEGAKGFVRGLTPALIRSPFVNGATFAAFELTMRTIG